jgi:hypothetical protein
MVFTVHDDVSVWNQPPLAGIDLTTSTVDLLSENAVMSFKLPFLPQIMKEVRNPLSLDPPTVDYSDNDQQMELIKHHFRSEFNEGRVCEVIKDYNQDAIIYEVIDEVPRTYHGKRGIQQMCRDVLGKVQNIELQHVAINRNHAQVVWKGKTKSHATIVGTDSFTFDHNNRIAAHSIVALTEKETEPIVQN